MNPWLALALSLFAVWLVLFAVVGRTRRSKMLRASVLTLPLGMTEPLFVPEYWDPPSLFNLAQRTGFDIESLVFSFALGGVASIGYDAVHRESLQPLTSAERHSRRHRFHRLALASPMLAFLVLWPLPWNVMYSVLVAFLVGAVATGLCRPDLVVRMATGAALFAAMYFVLLRILVFVYPHFVADHWNLDDLTGVLAWGIPLEEILFAAGAGALWSSAYEHFHFLSPQGSSA